MQPYKILFVILIYLLVSCQSPPKTGVVQASFNLENSKENGVYVSKYSAEPKSFSFDGQVLEIEEVWVEHIWWYVDLNRDIEMDEEVRGLIKFSDPDVNIYDIYEKISDRKFGITGNKLMFNVDRISDTVILKLDGIKSVTQVRLIPTPD